VIADDQAGRLAVVFEMLRLFAQNGMAEHEIVTAHCQRANQVSSRPYLATGADADVLFDYHKRANLDAFTDVSRRVDDGGGMNASGLCNRHKRTCPWSGGAAKRGKLEELQGVRLRFAGGPSPREES
jgi:hypothetical protein